MTEKKIENEALSPGCSWYVVVPNERIEHYDSPDEAQSAAESLCEFSGDAWPEEQESLEWGLMVPFGVAEAYDRKPAPKGSGVDDFVSYRLRAIDAPARLAVLARAEAEAADPDAATCDGCALPKPIERVRFGDEAITCDDCSDKLAAEEAAAIVWESEEGMDGGDVWTAEHQGWSLVVQGGLMDDAAPSWEWEAERDEPTRESVRGAVSVDADPEDDGWEAAANEAIATAKARAETVVRALGGQP